MFDCDEYVFHHVQGEIEMCKEGEGRLANLPFPLRVICLILLLPWIFYNLLRDVVEE